MLPICVPFAIAKSECKNVSVALTNWVAGLRKYLAGNGFYVWQMDLCRFDGEAKKSGNETI
jgi:hypothetical protein